MSKNSKYAVEYITNNNKIENFISGTKIRELINENKYDEVKKYVPNEVYNILITDYMKYINNKHTNKRILTKEERNKRIAELKEKIKARRKK